jgi:hypothetical protein
MAHWFDRLSDRAASGNGSMTRRELVRAGAGIGAAGALGSPLVGQAAGEAAALLRAGTCQCHDDADRRFKRAADSLVRSNGPTFLASPLNTLLFGLASGGLISGYVARKLSCGECRRSPSGTSTPAPPSHAPCRAARGGVCVDPGGGEGGCPAGTTFCSGGLCCFGDDLCCGCNGQPTCCVSAVGCACC